MGEEIKIVTQHYPAEKLPDELRRGIESGSMVRVTVEAEKQAEQTGAPRRSLRSFIGTGRGLFDTPEQATAFIRELRDEWDD